MRNKLKIFSSFIVLLLMVVFSTGCAQSESEAMFEPGTYEGEAEGFGGPITAHVTVTENEITDIETEIPDETPSIGGGAAEEITSDVLESQNLDVEVVSGATSSSEGLIAAITAALEKSRSRYRKLESRKRQRSRR